MAASDDVSYRAANGIARITVTRAARLNAYRDETADALDAALDAAETDPANRVVVLTGAGRAFGAGYDLSTVTPDQAPALEHVLERYFNPLDAPDATIAAADRLPGQRPVRRRRRRHGARRGYRHGPRTAYFYEPFVGIALVPDAGNTQFLTRTLGRIRAAATMLLGDRLSAEEALRLGLVWPVVDDAELDGRGRQDRDQAGVARTRRNRRDQAADRRRADLRMDDQLDLERDVQGSAAGRPR